MRRGFLVALLFVFLAGCAGAPAAKFPVTRVQGKYTVVAQTFRDDVRDDGTVNHYAVAMANEWASVLRKQGHSDVYVADLRNQAMVCMGIYPDRETALQALPHVEKMLEGIVASPVTIRGGVRTTGGWCAACRKRTRKRSTTSRTW